MATLRPIDASNYAAIRIPESFGPAPELRWLAIADLVVDPAYQRDIALVGRGNVRKIAQSFDWTKFAPIVVAPVEGGKYAIVDGQHRTTAAKLCGHDQVPAAIIAADRRTQAAAFRAINGTVTKLSSMQLYHASLAAGEADAAVVDRVCRAANVTILRYPKDWRSIGPRETMAVVVIRRAIKKFTDRIVISALGAICCAGEEVNCLRAPIIYGTAEVLADHPDWLKVDTRLQSVFARLDLSTMLEESAAISARIQGSSITDQFEARLVEALAAEFEPKRRRT
jgi:hypothetical protein